MGNEVSCIDSGIISRIRRIVLAAFCAAAALEGMMLLTADRVMAADSYFDANGVHIYRDTPEDEASGKYKVKVNGTDVEAVKYDANGNNFDIARFASDSENPEITVTVTEEIQSVTVYPERYYPQEDLKVSEDRKTLTFRIAEESDLRYAFVMINGGPADQAGKPYLALINDPEETDRPDPEADNVLNFKEFSEQYLKEHPNSTVQTAEEAGVTTGGVEYDAGKLVANDTSQVRFPDKRQMLEEDVTYALQAALDEIYAEGSAYDTLYFPDGTYICSGLELRDRKGKEVTIYVEEGALIKNRIQECMQAMEPAIGVWDSENITISGRGMFDGNGVENYRKDRHDAKDSCHQGGVMIVRSSNIVFNDTYVRDAKQWNWESHGSKNCTLNNIKGLTPYNQPWVDGLDMASAQGLTINGAVTMGNDDNFASGHYNPSDGFTNTVPGFDQYNSDALEWDTEDSFDISVNNTLGWSYAGGNGVRMGHNCYGHQMRNYTFTNLNATNFQGGGRGITVQNSTGEYPRYDTIEFINCSFDTSRVGCNFEILGRADDMISSVLLENCWFSNGSAVSSAQNIENLTISDLYIGKEKAEYSNFTNLTTENVTEFSRDWQENTIPEIVTPQESAFTAKVGEKITFQVTASDADNDEVSLTAEGLPEGAEFNTSTGVFSWRPAASQTGTRTISFSAADQWGAVSHKEITITVEAGDYSSIEISPSEDTYLASWKDEKNNNYEGNDYLRIRRMKEAIGDQDTYGLWGEKITDLADSKDAKVSVLKFDAALLRENLDNLEKAELELTLINRRESVDVESDRLMAAAVTEDWSAGSVTWNTAPLYDIADVKYSDSFKINTNTGVDNKTGIADSPYDGTRAVIDVTDFVRNLQEEENVLSIAVCEESGYELAFASVEGAAKLGRPEAAPVLRLTVKEAEKTETEVGRTTVLEDAFAGSWGGDQDKNFGGLNFIRTAYDKDSAGVLGSEGGSDNKLTYLKFDLTGLEEGSYDRVKLQMTLLGVRKSEALNLETQIQIGTAADESWSEETLTWKNKPAVTTAAADLVQSDIFVPLSAAANDPNSITAPEGVQVTADVTLFVQSAKEAGNTTLTLAVNAAAFNASLGSDANRYYFVSKEGAANYADAADMAPTLILTKYETEEKPEHTHSLTFAEAKNATCTENGSIAYYVCSECGRLFRDGEGAEEITAEDTVVAAAGHTWDEGVITTKPTVSEEGIRTYTCIVCQETKEEPVAKLTLSGIEVTAPVKTEYTVGDEQLDLTGMTVTAQYSDGSTEVIALDQVSVEGFDSTAAAEGQVITVTYQGMSDSFTVNIKEAEEPAHTHKLVKINKKRATWFRNGNITYYECRDCGRFYRDAAATEEITRAETVIKSKGYEWYTVQKERFFDFMHWIFG